MDRDDQALHVDDDGTLRYIAAEAALRRCPDAAPVCVPPGAPADAATQEVEAAPGDEASRWASR